MSTEFFRLSKSFNDNTVDNKTSKTFVVFTRRNVSQEIILKLLHYLPAQSLRCGEPLSNFISERLSLSGMSCPLPKMLLTCVFFSTIPTFWKCVAGYIEIQESFLCAILIKHGDFIFFFRFNIKFISFLNITTRSGISSAATTVMIWPICLTIMPLWKLCAHRRLWPAYHDPYPSSVPSGRAMWRASSQ